MSSAAAAACEVGKTRVEFMKGKGSGMNKGIVRPPLSLKKTLFCIMTLMLFVSCAPGQKAQEGQGSGVGSSSGQKTGRDKNPQGQDPVTPEPVETRLTRLFDLCKSSKWEDAAAFFVYRGEDKTREWKDTLRGDDPAEKGAIREICRRITGYLDESSGYSFDGVRVERESEGEWHALEVSFQQGEKKKKVIFAFLLIKGQYAIGDIDN